MTKEEAVILSAYTGYLLVDNFSDVHEFIEKILGRPVWTHQLADPAVTKEIREKCKPILPTVTDAKPLNATAVGKSTSMSIEEAIKRINQHMSIHHIGQYPHIHIAEALHMALDALREKAVREDPKPLTIEDLRQMSGEPVWMDGFEWRISYGVSTINGSLCLATGFDSWIPLDGYGETWFAYRHKPKEDPK